MVPRTCCTRYLVLGTRYLVQRTWYQVPGKKCHGTTYLVPGTMVPGTTYLVPSAWYQVPWYQVPGTRYVVPGTIVPGTRYVVPIQGPGNYLVPSTECSSSSIVQGEGGRPAHRSRSKDLAWGGVDPPPILLQPGGGRPPPSTQTPGHISARDFS